MMVLRSRPIIIFSYWCLIVLYEAILSNYVWIYVLCEVAIAIYYSKLEVKDWS